MARLFKSHSSEKLELGSNEITTTFLDKRFQEICSHQFNSFHLYPEEEKLVNWYSDLLKTDASKIELGHGSDDLIRRFFEIHQDKKVFIEDNEYAPVYHYANIYNIERVSQPENADIFYMSYIKGNPDTKHKTNNIISLAQHDNKPLLIDAVYLFPSEILNIERSNNTVIVWSVSKTLGLAGMRSGAALFNNPDLLTKFKDISTSYTSNKFTTSVLPEIGIDDITRHRSFLYEGSIYLQEKLNAFQRNDLFVFARTEDVINKGNFNYKRYGEYSRINSSSIDRLKAAGI